MGFTCSDDIFQAEMGNLMEALEYIQAYIDGPLVLVITKGSHDDHLKMLEAVFMRLRNAGLKVNMAKLFFCTQVTEYVVSCITVL